MKYFNSILLSIVTTLSIVLFTTYIYLFHVAEKYVPNVEGDLIVVLLCLLGGGGAMSLLWAELNGLQAK